MSTRKEAEKAFHDLQDQAQAIREEVASLESEAQGLDYAADPGAAVKRLETIEAGLSARRRALEAFTGKIEQAQREVEAIDQAVREKAAQGLRKQEHDLQLKAIDQLRDLKALLDDLDGVRSELLTTYRLHSQDVFGQQLASDIDYIFNQRAYFHRDLFGIDPKPPKQEQLTTSQRNRIDVLKKQVSDLKKRHGKWNSGVSRDDIDAAVQRLQDAEAQLARLEGRDLPEVGPSQWDLTLQQQAAEQAGMIERMKAKAAELRGA